MFARDGPDRAPPTAAMIAEDRELLAHLSRVNQGIAAAVPVLLAHLGEEGQLPPEGLNALADQLAAVVERLRARARADDERRAIGAAS